MKLIVASGNKDKVREIKSIFTNYEILSLKAVIKSNFFGDQVEFIILSGLV